MTSQTVFSAIRLAGAATLIFLGAQALWHALRNDSVVLRSDSPPPLAGDGHTSPPPLAVDGHTSPPPLAGEGKGGGIKRPFLQGLISNISNAKMVVFFTSLLPQFAGPHPGFTTLVVLGLNFSLLTLAWLSAYAVAVERMSSLLRRTGVRRAMEAGLGTVLVAFGLRLATESR